MKNTKTKRLRIMITITFSRAAGLTMTSTRSMEMQTIHQPARSKIIRLRVPSDSAWKAPPSALARSRLPRHGTNGRSVPPRPDSPSATPATASSTVMLERHRAAPSPSPPCPSTTSRPRSRSWPRTSSTNSAGTWTTITRCRGPSWTPSTPTTIGAGQRIARRRKGERRAECGRIPPSAAAAQPEGRERGTERRRAPPRRNPAPSANRRARAACPSRVASPARRPSRRGGAKARRTRAASRRSGQSGSGRRSRPALCPKSARPMNNDAAVPPPWILCLPMSAGRISRLG
mmetsp:Transcript_20380/g.43687  ORF Transcript_20380/g.43687 Transcript_20380/m.43687 type:complete len:289 (+) Transcript_20380:588-1454(+)